MLYGAKSIVLSLKIAIHICCTHKIPLLEIFQTHTPLSAIVGICKPDIRSVLLHLSILLYLIRIIASSSCIFFLLHVVL